MSIETRIQAINDHLIDDYKVLRLAGADLTDVNKNIVNLKPTWKERLLYFMNNGTDVVWNNWDKVVGSGTSITLNNTVEAPMQLTYKGNTYQEGTPTPSTPQQVHVVSGDNSIEVNSNIFDYTTNILNNANINQSNISSDNTCKLSYVKCKPNTQYKISRKEPMSTRFRVATTENVPQIGDSVLSYTQQDNASSITITTPANANYIVMRFIYNEVNDYDTYARTINVFEPSQSASYPISLGDKELCKIVDYQDKIFKNTPNTTDYDSNLEDNVWYVKKEIGKVVLNGTQNIIKQSTSNDRYDYKLVISDMIESYDNSKPLLSNKLTQVFNRNNISSGTAGICFGTSTDSPKNMIWFGVGSGVLSNNTVEGMNTYLSSNNITAYYPLATPTYETITDTTLISQLEEAKKSYESQTNISQENNDLPFELDVEALQKM